MGSQVNGEPLPKEGSEESVSSAPLSYTEQFYAQLPFYLSIGMTWDQFWNEDCHLTKYYLQAFKLKRKKDNFDAWLQGLYYYHAICDASPLLHAFAKSDTKPIPYLDKPLPMSKQEYEKDCEEREIQKMKEAAEAFKAFVDVKNAEQTEKE